MEAHNGLSAKIVEDMGFQVFGEVVYTSLLPWESVIIMRPTGLKFEKQ
jgi:hypothetical protein